MSGRDLRDWGLALALGAVGGACFAWAGMPLAWMIGAMAATTAGALSGLPVRVPPRLRAVMIAVLGLMLGSAFTPEVLGAAGAWWPSLAGLLAYVAAVTAAVALYFRRLGHGPVTAYFAAAPGGLNEMVLTGAALGGDDRVISLVHSLRILIIVFTVPVWFRVFGGYDAPPMGAMVGDLDDLGLRDALWLAATALVGALLGKALRLPAPALTGPMLLSAAAHLAGWTESQPPAELVGLAQVVTGAAIGCRFAGFAARRILPLALASLGSTGIMLALSVAATLVLAQLTGLPAAALLLAFVPGGLAEMCLISLALGVDVAFVSSHHVARILLVVVLAPAAFRLLGRVSGTRRS